MDNRSYPKILLIDDFRDAAPNGDAPSVIARSYSAGALFIVNDLLWPFDTVYVDHDLGELELDRTGYDLLSLLERRYHDFHVRLPRRIICVSDNGAGRKRMNQVIENLYGRIAV